MLFCPQEDDFPGIFIVQACPKGGGKSFGRLRQIGGGKVDMFAIVEDRARGKSILYEVFFGER